jgi:hypothetical protein
MTKKVLPTLKHTPCHEDVLGVEIQLHAFLTIALNGGECQFNVLAPYALYPCDRRLSRPWNKPGCGGDLKNPCPCYELNYSNQCCSQSKILPTVRSSGL